MLRGFAPAPHLETFWKKVSKNFKNFPKKGEMQPFYLFKRAIWLLISFFRKVFAELFA